MVSSYPSYPSSSNQLPNESVGAPPGPVSGAFAIYLINAVLAAVVVILVVTSGVWAQALADAGNATTSNGVSAQSLVNTVKVVSIVFGVIFLILYLLFAVKMRAGRNWARIVLTVLSALSILSVFTATAKVNVNGRVYNAGGSQVVGYAEAVLAVIAIVLMYTAASNQYFARAKLAKRR